MARKSDKLGNVPEPNLPAGFELSHGNCLHMKDPSALTDLGVELNEGESVEITEKGMLKIEPRNLDIERREEIEDAIKKALSEFSLDEHGFIFSDIGLGLSAYQILWEAESQTELDESIFDAPDPFADLAPAGVRDEIQTAANEAVRGPLTPDKFPELSLDQLVDPTESIAELKDFKIPSFNGGHEAEYKDGSLRFEGDKEVNPALMENLAKSLSAHYKDILDGRQIFVTPDLSLVAMQAGFSELSDDEFVESDLPLRSVFQQAVRIGLDSYVWYEGKILKIPHTRNRLEKLENPSQSLQKAIEDHHKRTLDEKDLSVRIENGDIKFVEANWPKIPEFIKSGTYPFAFSDPEKLKQITKLKGDALLKKLKEKYPLEPEDRVYGKVIYLWVQSPMGPAVYSKKVARNGEGKTEYENVLQYQEGDKHYFKLKSQKHWQVIDASVEVPVISRLSGDDLSEEELDGMFNTEIPREISPEAAEAMRRGSDLGERPTQVLHATESAETEISTLNLGEFTSGAITWDGKRRIGDRVIEYKEDGYYEDGEKLDEEACYALAKDINENHYPEEWKGENLFLYYDDRDKTLYISHGFSLKEVGGRIKAGSPATCIAGFRARYQGVEIESLDEHTFNKLLGEIRTELDSVAKVATDGEVRFISIISKTDGAKDIYFWGDNNRDFIMSFIENGELIKLQSERKEVETIDENGTLTRRELTTAECVKHIRKANELFRDDLAKADKADHEFALEDGKVVLKKKEAIDAEETVNLSTEEILSAFEGRLSPVAFAQAINGIDSKTITTKEQLTAALGGDTELAEDLYEAFRHYNVIRPSGAGAFEANAQKLDELKSQMNGPEYSIDSTSTPEDGTVGDSTLIGGDMPEKPDSNHNKRMAEIAAMIGLSGSDQEESQEPLKEASGRVHKAGDGVSFHSFMQPTAKEAFQAGTFKEEAERFPNLEPTSDSGGPTEEPKRNARPRAKSTEDWAGYDMDTRSRRTRPKAEQPSTSTAEHAEVRGVLPDLTEGREYGKAPGSHIHKVRKRVEAVTNDEGPRVTEFHPEESSTQLVLMRFELPGGEVGTVSRTGEATIMRGDQVIQVEPGSAEAYSIASMLNQVATEEQNLNFAKSIYFMLLEGRPELREIEDGLVGYLADGRLYVIKKNGEVWLTDESGQAGVPVREGSLEAGLIAGFVNKSESYKNMWAESAEMQASVLRAPEGVEAKSTQVEEGPLDGISIPEKDGSPMVTREALEEQFNELTRMHGLLETHKVSDKKTHLLLMQARRAGWKPDLKAGDKVSEKINHMEADAWMRALPEEERKFHEELVEAVLSAQSPNNMREKLIQMAGSGELPDTADVNRMVDVLRNESGNIVRGWINGKDPRKVVAQKIAAAVGLDEATTGDMHAAAEVLRKTIRKERNTEQNEDEKRLMRFERELHRIFEGYGAPTPVTAVEEGDTTYSAPQAAARAAENAGPDLKRAAKIVEGIIKMKKRGVGAYPDGYVDWRVSETLDSEHSDMENQARFELVQAYLPEAVRQDEFLIHQICEEMSGPYSREKVIVPGSEREEVRTARVDRMNTEIEQERAEWLAANIRVELAKTKDAKGRVQFSDEMREELLQRFAPEYMTDEEKAAVFEAAVNSFETGRAYKWRRKLSRPQDEREARRFVIENNLHEDAMEALFNSQLEGLNEHEARQQVRRIMIEGLRSMEDAPENVEYAVDFALDVAMGEDELKESAGFFPGMKDGFVGGAEWGRDKIFDAANTTVGKAGLAAAAALAAGAAFFTAYKAAAFTRTAASLTWRMSVEGAKAAGRLGWQGLKALPSFPGRLWKGIQTAWNPASITAKNEKGEEYNPLARKETDGVFKRFGKWSARTACMLSLPISSPVYAAYTTLRGDAPQLETIERTEGEGDDAKTIKEQKVVSSGTGIRGWWQSDGPKMAEGFKSAWEKGVFTGPFRNAAEERKRKEAAESAGKKPKLLLERMFDAAGDAAALKMQLTNPKTLQRLANGGKRALLYMQHDKDWKPMGVVQRLLQDSDFHDVAALSTYIQYIPGIPEAVKDAVSLAATGYTLLTPRSSSLSNVLEFADKFGRGKTKDLGIKVAEASNAEELDVMLDAISFDTLVQRHPILGVEGKYKPEDLDEENERKAMKRTMMELMGFKLGGDGLIRDVFFQRVRNMKNNLDALNQARPLVKESKDEQRVVTALLNFAEFFLDETEGQARFEEFKAEELRSDAGENVQEVNFDASGVASSWLNNGPIRMIANLSDLDGAENEEKRRAYANAIASIDFKAWDQNKGINIFEDFETISRDLVHEDRVLEKTEREDFRDQFTLLLGRKAQRRTVISAMSKANENLEKIKEDNLAIEDFTDDQMKVLDDLIEVTEFFASNRDVLTRIFEEPKERKKKDEDAA